MVTGKFYRVMDCPQLITYKNISSVRGIKRNV